MSWLRRTHKSTYRKTYKELVVRLTNEQLTLAKAEEAHRFPGRTNPQGVFIPEAVCKNCHQPIEWFNETWWVQHTCKSQCEVGWQDHVPVSVHYDPAPIHDLAALERWLQDG